VLVEYARNVAGIEDAAHAEQHPGAAHAVAVPLACSLVGEWREVRTVPGTQAARLCGPGPLPGYHLCSYGLAVEYEPVLEAAGLVVAGRAPDAGVEIVELPGHPFFMASLFQPQVGAEGEALHGLIRAFAGAVAEHRGRLPAITVVAYDPAWPARYRAEEVRLRGALGPAALRIEHVGSTSVPGLGAKDIVDIQVSVRSFEPQAAYQDVLERLGYYHRPDPEAAHRFFGLLDASGRRIVNLHVCEAGSEWERRHLAFRDRLRADRQLCREYERLKRRLAPLHTDANEYAAAKGEFIEAAQGPPAENSRCT
jgi:GrpB-like predicted nucleotidyltransferase (UPF0157 family)